MRMTGFYILLSLLLISLQMEAQIQIPAERATVYAPHLSKINRQAFIIPPYAAGNKALPKPLQSNLYTQQLGFFCKQEIKMEQGVKLPLRLRLGSLEYTDWMERKAGSVMPAR